MTGKRCAAAKRFWDACVEVGISQLQVEEAIEAAGLDEKQKTNLDRFLNGPAKSIGPTVRGPFDQICGLLKMNPEDLQLDEVDRHTDHLAEFAGRNSGYYGKIEEKVGKYVAYRPHIVDDRITFEDDPLPCSLEIFPNGKNRQYAFRFQNGHEPRNGVWAGPVISVGDFLYLLGFDQLNQESALTMILSPLPGPDRLLAGSMLMRLNNSDHPGQRDKAAGRPIVAIKETPSQSFQRRNGQGIAWLKQQGENDCVKCAGIKGGFVVDLRRSHTEPREG